MSPAAQVCIRSQYVHFSQVELLLGHCEVSQVPEYPEHQTEEDDQRSRQDKKVPETQWGEDPDKKEDEADHIHDHCHGQKDDGGSPLLHFQVIPGETDM
ncbi:hypothetical protein FQA47_016097 [Xyrichtys novacula]|uniref:Uncharacterized protein n=1 Tax=Xyrichtys novacula TaxID=13765 RepID=A0AAV1GQN6_XYRNO|nr:hypothetical protein FQA47_016097 [Xyrichtys novacula]